MTAQATPVPPAEPPRLSPTMRRLRKGVRRANALSHTNARMKSDIPTPAVRPEAPVGREQQCGTAC